MGKMRNYRARPTWTGWHLRLCLEYGKWRESRCCPVCGGWVLEHKPRSIPEIGYAAGCNSVGADDEPEPQIRGPPGVAREMGEASRKQLAEVQRWRFKSALPLSVGADILVMSAPRRGLKPRPALAGSIPAGSTRPSMTKLLFFLRATRERSEYARNKAGITSKMSQNAGVYLRTVHFHSFSRPPALSVARCESVGIRQGRL